MWGGEEVRVRRGEEVCTSEEVCVGEEGLWGVRRVCGEGEEGCVGGEEVCRG